MNRLDHLRETHAPALFERFLAREHGPERAWATPGAEALFARFAEADPSRGKSHLAWILRLYLTDRLQAEDLYKVPETLLLFQRVRRHLPEASRALSAHADLPSLWRAIAPHAEQPSRRARAAGERERARADSRLVYEDAELIVAVPQTQEAAMWWGRGTRWCTAAEEDNAFSRYDHEGPLVVFIVRGAKFQLHAPSDTFHDAADGPVDAFAVLGPYLSRLQAAGHAGLAFAIDPLAAPPEARSEEGLRSALSEWGTPLHCLPEEQRTEGLCRLAIARDARQLSQVPDDRRTRELCLEAVSHEGEALVFVPFALRDRELCLTAIQRGAFFGDVPDEHRDRELCLEAMRRPFALGYVPFALRDAEVCDRALCSSPAQLQHVPWALRDRETCARALEGDGLQLAFVPERYRDSELCLRAVQDTGAALNLVPLALRDLELCIAAVREDPRLIHRTPPHLHAALTAATGVDPKARRFHGLEPLDSELSRAMSAQDGTYLERVPEALRTREVCLRKVAWERDGLAHVPEALRDSEICLRAVRDWGQALHFVPESLRDEDVCRAAMRNGGEVLSLVPLARRGRELCLEAIRAHVTPHPLYRGSLESVPDGLRDAELCLAAVIATRSLTHTPFARRDAALGREAVTRNPEALVDVPHALRAAVLRDAGLEEEEVERLRRRRPPQ